MGPKFVLTECWFTPSTNRKNFKNMFHREQNLLYNEAAEHYGQYVRVGKEQLFNYFLKFQQGR